MNRDFAEMLGALSDRQAEYRIDILTRISGVDFQTAWAHRLDIQIGGRTIPILGRAELITNKKATGRVKDLGDLELLEG